MNTINTTIPFQWASEVRAHELDLQGIVNNAHYLCYLDHARTLYLKERGVDWSLWQQNGFSWVLTQVDIRFLRPLRVFDQFIVHSAVERVGPIKWVFTQEICCPARDEQNCRALSTVVCVNTRTNRAIAYEKTLAHIQVS